MLGLKKDNAIDFLVFKAGHFQFEGVMPHCNNVTCIFNCTFYIILYIKGGPQNMYTFALWNVASKTLCQDITKF